MSSEIANLSGVVVRYRDRLLIEMSQKVRMVRILIASTPLDQDIVLDDVPEDLTAGALSQALLVADLDGQPFEIRIQQNGRVLAPTDVVVGGEVVLLFDTDPFRRLRVFTAIIFWIVHLLPASLWLFGSDVARCVPVYFIGAFILYLIAATSPVTATSVPVTLSAVPALRLAQIFVVSMSPRFELEPPFEEDDFEEE
jgi:hypothetical protein